MIQIKNNSILNKLIKHPLFILTAITIIITIYLLNRQAYIGVSYYDVYVYLNNAVIFAGGPAGNLSVIYLSPLMPFLTSLIFRLGYVSENVIFILDGLIFIFGVIGFYLLLRTRFNQIQSFAASLVFLSFPLIFAWAVSGGIDVPGIMFSIWTIYLLILGVEKNSKYLYLVIPLFALAVLARYTSIILIFPMVLYILISNNPLDKLKKISVGLLAGLSIMIPFLMYIYAKLGNLDSIINIFTSTLLGASGAVNDLGYNPDKLYYLNNILSYISINPLQGFYNYMLNPHMGNPSIITYIIIPITIIGLLISFSHYAREKLTNTNYSIKSLILPSILIILTVFGVVSFFTSSYMITEIFAISIIYVTYKILNTDNNNIKIDLLFISWFAAFFIFHSIIPLKEDRYFITMLPALAYFIILGTSNFIKEFKFKIRNNPKTTSVGLYSIIGLLFLSSTMILYVAHPTPDFQGYDMQPACNWLMQNDPQYQNQEIYSNYDPAATWYLKKEVKFAVPALYTSSKAFSTYLTCGNADYYIDSYSSNPTIPHYHIVYQYRTVTIYHRNN